LATTCALVRMRLPPMKKPLPLLERGASFFQGIVKLGSLDTTLILKTALRSAAKSTAEVGSLAWARPPPPRTRKPRHSMMRPWPTQRRRAESAEGTPAAAFAALELMARRTYGAIRPKSRRAGRGWRA